MPAKWQRWMPLEIDALRASPAVQAMHPSARAGYVWLLLDAWQTDDCTIPSDPLDLAEKSGLGDELWVIHGPRILRKFDPVEGTNKLRNQVCYEKWLEAKDIYDGRHADPEEVRRKRSEAGKKGNAKRWSKSQTDRNCDTFIAKPSQTRQTKSQTDRYTETETETETNTEEQRQKPTAPSADSQPSEPPSSPVVGSIPLSNKTYYKITQAKLDEWQELFPAVDVLQKCREIRAWGLANPTKQKTPKGIERHIVGWLTKEQDRGGSSHAKTNGGYTNGNSKQARNNETLAAALAYTADRDSAHRNGDGAEWGVGDERGVDILRGKTLEGVR